jgi:hypothetical protein
VLAILAFQRCGMVKSLVGYVRVEHVAALRSVVQPIEFDGEAAPTSLSTGCWAQLIFRDFGDQQVSIAVVPSRNGEAPASTEHRDRLDRRLREASRDSRSLFRIADEANEAQWLVHLKGHEVYVAPATGWVARGATGAPSRPIQRFMAGIVDDELPTRLEEQLARISRVQFLLGLASSSPTAAVQNGNQRLDLEVEVVRLTNESDTNGEVVVWNKGRTLFVGERVGFRVVNRSQVPVDVTLLYIGDDFAIEPVFPCASCPDNRLPAGASVFARCADVTEASAQEHIVAIVVRSVPNHMERVDFAYLWQPGLTRSGDTNRTITSPLGRLLETALQARGATRGLDAAEVQNHVVDVVSWQVTAAE